MKPKDEAIKALTTVVEKLGDPNYQDAFARHILKATAQYALEQVALIQEVKRARKAAE